MGLSYPIAIVLLDTRTAQDRTLVPKVGCVCTEYRPRSIHRCAVRHMRMQRSTRVPFRILYGTVVSSRDSTASGCDTSSVLPDVSCGDAPCTGGDLLKRQAFCFTAHKFAEMGGFPDIVMMEVSEGRLRHGIHQCVER